MDHIFKPGTTGATLLLLHGEGGDETDLTFIAPGIAPGAAVLSPRLGPLGAEAAEVAEDAAALAHWVEHGIEHYALDPTRVYALGYSDGANLASALLLLHPALLAGAILLRPKRVLEPKPLPKLRGIPVLVAGGEGDTTMPEGESEQVARLLSHVGADVDYAVADTGHELSPSDFAMCKKWLAQFAVPSAPRSSSPAGNLPDQV
jgi:phospholipase/carboxylesterase